MPDVPIGEAPSVENIATRIDMGSAEYHEHCCAWMLTNDGPDPVSCNCGGPEMARAYVELRGLVEKIATDFGPDSDLGYLAKEALDAS